MVISVSQTLFTKKTHKIQGNYGSDYSSFREKNNREAQAQKTGTENRGKYDLHFTCI
jgi:hypothetical protein